MGPYCLAEAGLKLPMKLKLAQPVIFPGYTSPRLGLQICIIMHTLTHSFYRGRNYISKKTWWGWQQPLCEPETRPTQVLLAPAVDTGKRTVVQVKMRQVQEELVPIYIHERQVPFYNLMSCINKIVIENTLVLVNKNSHALFSTKQIQT